MLNEKGISRQIRLHDANIVEVNPTYAIVTKTGLTEDIESLYAALQEFKCVLQYVRSGRIAITKSRREHISDYINEREEKHREMMVN